MRILIVDTYYPAFLESHYAEQPQLTHASYDIQWRGLMNRFFGTSDAYSYFLGELGHESKEVVVNCKPLQHRWAEEHGIRWLRRVRPRHRETVVLAQAEEFQPDVVYVQDLTALSPGVLRRLRALSQLLVGQIASEPPESHRLAPFDLILTSFPHFPQRFRNEGIPSEYLRLGFDPRVLGYVGEMPRTTGAVFLGALARGPHGRGNELLERVARRAPIDFWGYDASYWPADSAIRRQYQGEAWGLDMYRVLASATIALNRHIDVAEDFANNMRLYETTGLGALLITDAKRNLSDLFEPGVEVVTYSSEDELVERIHHYLRDEAARSQIARAGQARTLREHTYRRRMEELVKILSRYLS